MNEFLVYKIVLAGCALIGLVSFVALFFVTAPYGRHTKKGWGPLIPNTPAWVMMEAPASLLMLVYLLTAQRALTPVLIAFFVIWQIHYFHRSFIFPFQLKAREMMPLSIILFGVLFNAANTYIQGKWLYVFSPESMYTVSWFYDPRFIIGVVIFCAGFAINKHADAVLRALWDPNDPGYKIPYGGMYRFISCPNYLGEMLTWAGWAVMTWSIAGLYFVLWTIFNLAPRARSNHKWYRDNFPDYPKERKALVPFIY
ncbi:MAG TPA: methyltransferase [Spirochaetota bacterium]|nr:methyltransferase [Spirochaetota bacterium]